MKIEWWFKFASTGIQYFEYCRQSVAIAILVKLDWIPQGGTWVFYHNIHDVATGLQASISKYFVMKSELVLPSTVVIFYHHPH